VYELDVFDEFEKNPQAINNPFFRDTFYSTREDVFGSTNGKN